MEPTGEDPPCPSRTHQRTHGYSFVPGRSGEREASGAKVHHRHGYFHKQKCAYSESGKNQLKVSFPQRSAERRVGLGLNATCVCVCRKLREAMNAQKNAQRAAMRAHFRRKYQLSEVGKAPATPLKSLQQTLQR